MKSLFSFSRKYFSQNLNLVKYEYTNKIGILTINNAAKRNALSYSVLESFNNRLNEIENSKDEKPKVLIITSEGYVFSSGHDLKELSTLSKEKQRACFDLSSSIMIRIQNMPQVVIAEVQGLATAAGCQIACACDLAIATSKAQFATPGVKVGLFCTTPSVSLGRVISQKRAMQMLVTGEPINAQKAYDWGILNEIVDVESEGNDFEKERKKLREATMKLANQINQYSGDVLSYGKNAFYKQVKMPDIEGAYGYACKIMGDNLDFDDKKKV